MMRTAAHPHLQPQVDAIYSFFDRSGMTISDALRRIYGVGPEGQVRGTGSLYPLLNGNRRVSAKMAAKLLPLGLDLRPFAKGPILPVADGLPATRAAAAVAAYEAELTSAPAVPPPTAPWRPADAPPRLAMALDAAGRGSLTFNLQDVAAGEVLRAFSVLQAAGLADDTSGPDGQ